MEDRMQSSIRRLWLQHPSVAVICGMLLFIAVSGLLASGVIFYETFRSGDFLSRPICLTNGCVSAFASNFDQVFFILKFTLDLSVAVATAGGIVVALLSYLTSVRVAALTNHVSHLNLFQQYITLEIQKRDRLAPSCVDGLRLYNMIFFLSREGSTEISPAYIKYLHGLNDLIATANNQARRGDPSAFRYKPHQQRMRDYLANAGITVYMAPRNDFYEVEGQLFELIDTVNQCMCYSNQVPKLTDRAYI